MGAEAVAYPAVLLVPFPAQGHITPMLQLASVLAAHGVAPTVAVPDFIHRRIATACGGCVGGGVTLASIPSGIVQDSDDDTPGFRDIVHSMEHHMPLHLERMLTASPSPRRGPPVACVVVDVLASWAVPVAARCGVPAAGFWPAMLACYRVVAAIPELLEKGLISESGQNMSSNTSEASGTHDSEEGASLTPRRTRSNVWEHFQKDLVNVDGELKAVCKYCHLKLATKSGTSSLRGHVANACPAIDSAIRKRFQASISKQPVDTDFVFDEQLCRKAMIKYIIHAEVPFLQFEDPYLQPWIDLMQPAFKVKHRQTIRSDCFKQFEDLKTELHTELQSLDSRVCLTSDLWTASQNLGYMAVTAHYVDVDFKIKKKIIWFKVLEYPHSGYTIEEELVKCLTEWGIRDKLFTLTLDNASNNTSACEELIKNHKQELMFEGEHLHVRCSAHILNLLVQDGMGVIHIAIEKIRELLKHIDSSVSRLQVFNSLANGMGLASKAGIYLDIPTRWNSTFRMLREALKYKAVINSYAPKYFEETPTEEEWEKARAVCEFLKAFEELTLAVSAHRKPTSHRFLPLVLCILHALKDPAWQSTDLLKELALSMHSKFEKYWNPTDDDLHNVANRKRKKKEIAFSLVLVIATVLDPRRKVDFLHFFFERVFSDTSKIEKYVRYAVEWMRKYFTLYEQRCARTSSNEQQCARTTSNMGSPVLGKRKIEVDFAQYASRRRVAQAPKAEIDTYFEEPLEPDPDNEDFDILEWWKSRSDKFPVLSTMVRDFLAIPLSTVSSESAFSLGGRILGERRSSLAPEMLEALVCGKDWLFMTKDLADEDQDPEPEEG